MARRYSYDLRMKIFKAVDDGLSIVKACKIFNISRNTIYRWKHLKRETGDIKAKPYGPAKGYNAKIDLKEFEELIINHHDKTAKELSIILGNRLQRTRINYYRKLLGYTYKKTHFHPKRDTVLRDEFIEKIKQISKENLVFIDESGIEDNACREYGWSIKGTRCYGNKAYQHKSRVSMIAGLCNNQIIAPVIFEGNCNKAIFTTYVETILIKELRPGQIVIMDNINFHKNNTIKVLIESVGCSILFLPTYSPDLNPIEHYWFKIKNEIRKVTAQFKDISIAVAHLMKFI
ncbi:IS630 family transposase [Orientia tsutsugamushi]|uniref:IS630 family transposase n=1 Tax=Orientia tsutsugamushi TaxID=784 RepID=UPI000D686C31|nr:IS630 family transposase [Orientia tsutsugamushi]